MASLYQWARRQATRVASAAPPIRRLREQRDHLDAEVQRLRQLVDHLEHLLHQSGGAPVGRVRVAFPAGHFYSPIPDLDGLVGRDEALYGRDRRLPGVDMAPARQLAWLDRFAQFYRDIPYPVTGPERGLRYRFDNPFFAHADGVAYYSMLRAVRPQRIIEVGSGWSSALALDVNERFLDSSVELTFIEPFTDRLDALLRHGDSTVADVIAKPLQDVDLSIFERLRAGDLLFIDSTHVSKVGSDVNELLLDVLPSLAPGVHVHLHDIFFPFEYPRAWLDEGRAWNEAYVLNAYLVHNDRIQINWFNSYLAQHHAERVTALLPLWGRAGGGSLWLETRAAAPPGVRVPGA